MNLNEVQLSVSLSAEDVRKLSAFIKEQCRQDRNVAREEAARMCDKHAEDYLPGPIAAELKATAFGIRQMKEGA